MHSLQNDKVNILVVDDSPDNLRLLSAMLTTQGYEVRKALTGKMALKACKSLQPNLILLDINMPEMNGYEVCQQLKADKTTSEVPVIFISALDDVLDKVKAFDVGGADYITKPFHAAEVISRIENQINLRSLQVKLYQKNALLQKTLEELKAAQVQQIQNEKMFSLGHLVAGIAHEVNNPVSFIYGNLEYVSEYVRDLINLVEAYQQEYPHPNQNIQKIEQKIDLDFLMKDLESLMGAMYRGVDRIRSIVLALQNFSRHDETSHKQVNIHHGLDSAIVMLHHRLGKTNYRNTAIKIVKQYRDLPLIYCYPRELNQVFMHLLSNAIDSLDQQAKNHQAENKTLQDLTLTPTIWISTCGIESDRPSKSGGLCVKPSAYEVARISITDNGTGIPDKVREYIFDPFFTTKAVGKGSGLGLSICYQIIVQKHCGRILCNSTPEQGAEFTIEIPIKQLQSN